MLWENGYADRQRQGSEGLAPAVDTALYRAKAEGRDRVVTGKALE